MTRVKDTQFHEIIFVLSDVRSRNMVKKKRDKDNVRRRKKLMGERKK